MSRPWLPLVVFCSVVTVSAILVIVFQVWGVLATVAVMMIYGWVFFAFLHYRAVRQEELLHLLTTLAETDAPLAPALWAYVNDRPHSDQREVWTALLQLIILPGYYWIWHRQNSFDRKVERVAAMLDDGAYLHQALGAAPGVATRETVLAAAIGESTGRLAACLRSVPRWRLVTIWLDALPRLLYPLFLMLFVVGAVTFLMLFIVPKFEKIFADSKMSFPWLTRSFIETTRHVLAGGLLGLIAPALVLSVIVMLSSSRVCWYFPGFGWLYRLHARSRFLRALALLLETNMPVPRALAVLASSGYFSGVVRQRIQQVRSAVEDGEPLPEQLYRHGLLPRRMMPLTEAAIRAQNLPWALGEMGETLARRLALVAHRVTMTLFPLLVAGVGLVVGIVAVSLFWPLVKMISEMPT